MPGLHREAVYPGDTFRIEVWWGLAPLTATADEPEEEEELRQGRQAGSVEVAVAVMLQDGRWAAARIERAAQSPELLTVAGRDLVCARGPGP